MSLALIFFNANAWANSEQEAVTIIGTQEDLQSLSGSGAIITSDDLDMFEFSDVGKALALVPGVYFQSHSYILFIPHFIPRLSSS